MDAPCFGCARRACLTVVLLCSTRALAEMQGTVEETYALFDQQSRGSGKYGAEEDKLTPSQAADQEANMLMDRVASGDLQTWDEIRPQLCALLQEAGHTDAAKFIEAATQMQV